MKLFPADSSIREIRLRCHASGTRVVTGDETEYESRAVVPHGDWKPLTAQQAEDLCGETDERRMVEVVRVPDDLLAAIIEAGPQYEEAPVLTSTGAMYRGEMVCAGDQQTTTVNYPAGGGLRIGMHLDNWDEQSCATRLDSRRRLMVNLGPSARWLIVGSADAVMICQELYPEDYADRYPHTDDVAPFVQLGLMECLRIRIEPGEGYIAPTELLVHDGSTSGIAGPSTALFWLGRFPQKALPSALVP